MGLSQLHKRILIAVIEKSASKLGRICHELKHSINTLYWLCRLIDNPKESLQVAALLHDCDRFIESQRVKKEDFESYDSYKVAHSQKAADIAKEILEQANEKNLIEEVYDLIKDHEFGKSSESKLICDADSLSFFDKNLITYLNEEGQQKTEEKINFMYNKLSEKAKGLLRQTNLEFKKCPTLNDYFNKII